MSAFTKSYDRESMKPSQIDALNRAFKIAVIEALDNNRACELIGTATENGFDFLLRVEGQPKQRASIGHLGKISFNENFVCGQWV